MNYEKDNDSSNEQQHWRFKFAFWTRKIMNYNEMHTMCGALIVAAKPRRKSNVLDMTLIWDKERFGLIVIRLSDCQLR